MSAGRGVGPGRWAQLVARVLRPERPRLAEARAVVTGLEDVAAAWAALAARGLVPGAIPGADNRGWAYRAAALETAAAWTTWTPGTTWAPGAHRALPATVDAAVALAADPDGVIRAGTWALEAVARLAPHGFTAGGERMRVAWRVVDAAWRPAGMVSTAGALAAACHTLGELPASAPVWREVATAVRRRRDTVPPELDWDCLEDCLTDCAGDCAGHWAWQRAAAAGSPGFRADNDPFEPLVAVWAEGYAVDRVEGDVVVLATIGV